MASDPLLAPAAEPGPALLGALALAWGLSVLPSVLLGDVLDVPGATRLGAALLPWLVLASLPRGASLRAAPLVALPPLGLALGLDLAAGAPSGGLLLLAGGGALLFLGWTALAELARRTPRSRSHYAWLWLLLVPLPAAAATAFAWAGASGAPAQAPAWVSAAALDPLVWAHRLARAGGLEEARWSGLLAPLAGLGLGALWIGALARREPAA